MNTRPLYFLKDKVTGKFYSGQGNDYGEFVSAAMYHQIKNAKSGLKRVIDGWVHQRECADYWVKESMKKNSPTDKVWARQQKEDVELRKDLPDWGVEIVGGTVTV
jgi:hypothetical protein